MTTMIQPLLDTFDPIELLTKDLKDAARMITPTEARFLVDYYYIIQEDRKRTSNQKRALSEDEEPSLIIDWLVQNNTRFESSIKKALDVFSAAQEVGQWARSILGVGPVIASGLLAHIDMDKTPSIGALWRFAGYDPTSQWLGKEKAEALLKTYPGPITTEMIATIAQDRGLKYGTLLNGSLDDNGKPSRPKLIAALAKRPYNADLKVLCWKLGECFVYVSGNPDSLYGRIYRETKAREIARNESGELAEQAREKLERFKIGRDTEAYKHYSAGSLPPAHIHARAKRRAIKIFLSHYWQVAYQVKWGVPAPDPWIIAHGGHQDLIPIPGWPMEEAKAPV